MGFNVENAVLVQRHLVQGAGASHGLERATQSAVVDGGAVQLEYPVCTVQCTTAVDRRIHQGYGLSACDDGSRVLDRAAVQCQVSSLRGDGALVGEVCVDEAVGAAKGGDRQLLADGEGIMVVIGPQKAPRAIAAQTQRAHASQIDSGVRHFVHQMGIVLD